MSMLVSTWNSAGLRPPRLAAAVCAAALLLVARPVPAVDEEGCLGCHGLAGLAVREDGGRRDLGIAGRGLENSIHSELGCSECHTDIASIPHGGHRDPACGQPCHGRSAGGKEYSHEGLYWEYATSVHGSARSRKIGCLVCHPAPERKETLERDKLEEARRCAACHRGSARVREWFQDRHFLALAAGNRRAPSCPDCHTSHRIRPASAPESTVHPLRLADTCSNGAVSQDRRGGCHGALDAGAVAGASMNPLPRGRSERGRLALWLTLLTGLSAAGLIVRAGVGLLRGR